MSTIEPLVHIIIITFNGRHHLELCLPSLLNTDYTNYEILLVDNASNDGSSEYVKEHYPGVAIIRNPTNYGFAKGNNVAMQLAVKHGAKYVLLLNDDTVILDKNWLRHAVQVVEEDSRVGMIGFDLTDDMSKQPAANLTVSDVTRISGCALMIRSDLLKNLGFFDEVYFAYAEESDLEARAIKAGYRLRQLDVPLYHKGGGSFSRIPVTRSFLFIRNWIRFSIKNESSGKAFLRPFIILDLFCNPFSFRRRSIDTALCAKISSQSYPVNFLLWVGAVLWNIMFLPQTLLIRSRNANRIRYTKGLLYTQETRDKC